MAIRVDPAVLDNVATVVRNLGDGLTGNRRYVADASVKADDGHTGSPECDEAQLQVGLQLAEAAMRLENTFRQLAVNLSLCAVAFDQGDYLASLPPPPPPPRHPVGPVA
jgi:hypothetical protein